MKRNDERILVMKILALDIGAGTEDVLLHDDEMSVENCIKMVLPSPSQVFSARVRNATRLKRDLFVSGDTVGGGAFAHALRRHVKAGLKVIMTEESAFTVRNNLDEVHELGIETVKRRGELRDFQGETLVVEEVNLTALQKFLTVFGETLSDVKFVAIAVQDHGVFPKGSSNRRSRINRMKELLKRNPEPDAFAFMENEIPSGFLRMKSAALAAKKQLPEVDVLLMDTAPDAILGCLKDPVVEKQETVLAANVGNGHTMVAIISADQILGIMEHHTRLLTPQKLEKLLIDFADGKLSNEEVFEDGGHGLFFLKEAPGFSKIDQVVATGPNRRMLAETGFSVHFATPGGDVMMTGPIGLVEAVKRKVNLSKAAILRG